VGRHIAQTVTFVGRYGFWFEDKQLRLASHAWTKRVFAYKVLPTPTTTSVPLVRVPPHVPPP